MSVQTDGVRLRLALLGSSSDTSPVRTAIAAVESSCVTDVDLIVLGSAKVHESALRQRASGVAGLRLTFAECTSEAEADRLLGDRDLLLLPAGEGAGSALTARRAQHMGVPVLASRLSPAAAIIAEGENGMSYSLDDFEELGQLLRRLDYDRALLTRLQTGARAFAAASSERPVEIPGGEVSDGSTHAEVFSAIYRQQVWVLGGESASGPGSRRDQTQILRVELPRLLARLEIHRVLDLGCGDFNWMRELELAVEEYIGVDVVPEIIAANRERYERPGRRFVLADLTRDPLPEADLVLCRDVLVHFSNRELPLAIDAILATGARYLLAGTFIARAENPAISLGDWRPVNLELPPASLPPAMETIVETPDVAGYEDKRLGLWDLSQIRERW